VSNESDKIECFVVSDEDQDLRLDIYLTIRPIALSRSRIQSLVKGGCVTVNEIPTKVSYRVRSGDRVCISIPPPSSPELQPEDVRFDILHEDGSLIVINKPPGIVVHPAPGHSTGTLVHGLLQHCQDLSGIGGVLRPGIVHRLDKDTSGLMVVAKNDQAHAFLAAQFKGGEVRKEYLTFVHGRVKENEGIIDLPLGRHPTRRKEMSVSPGRGKRALTLWKKLREFTAGVSFLSVTIKTGRTHQIRVHLSYMGHPVVGDKVYGQGRSVRRTQGQERDPLEEVQRQLLHSHRLSFLHPDGLRRMDLEAPLPGDMSHLFRELMHNEPGR
jgi:23S rRNA pseudouridine1911/1915/1917 synthase